VNLGFTFGLEEQAPKMGVLNNRHKFEVNKRRVGLRLSSKVLQEILEELQEIKLLYKELSNKLIPVEEATKQEKKAIEEKDDIADEEELMKTLG
jgi:archaellum component FlaC